MSNFNLLDPPKSPLKTGTLTKEEKYRSLLRALRRSKGFRLLFVECSSLQAEWLITNSKKDLPHKKIVVYKLEQAIKTFYDLVAQEIKKQDVDTLFIQGLEHSFYEYEAQRKEEDWSSEDIYNYSWKSVPAILSHLNQQRERFRDDFNICFVFILPRFAINYFIRRAPDFFDWRSNLFCFPLDKDSLQQEYSKLAFGNIADYQTWTSQQRRNKLVEIQGLLDEKEQTQAQKVNLYFEQGLLNQIDNHPKLAIASYDKAIEINPQYDSAWYNRGITLSDLGRFEEAIASYERALEINPQDDSAWNNRGNALSALGRFEEAIASYDKAIEIKRKMEIG